MAKATNHQVLTTSFILNPTDVDYAEVQKHFRIFEYTANPGLFVKNRENPYQRMSAALREQTPYTFYPLPGRHRIYLCVPSSIGEPPELRDYEDRHITECKEFAFNPFAFNPHDAEHLVILFKAAVRTFCTRDENDEAFVGTGKIYFLTGENYTNAAGRNYRKVLGITPIHNWKQARRTGLHEIFMKDQLGLMRQLTKQQVAKISRQTLPYHAYYRLVNNGKSFVPLMTADLEHLDKIDVYEVKGENYKKTNSRPQPTASPQKSTFASNQTKKVNNNQITFFSLGSEEQLKHSRSYVLDQRLTAVRDYLHSIGIHAKRHELRLAPVSLKPSAEEFRLESVSIRTSKTSSKASSHEELPVNQYPVTLIDARWGKPERPFHEIVNLSTEVRKDCTFKVAEKPVFTTAKSTDRFLVIRDYGPKAFEEGGPLEGQSDPYHEDKQWIGKGVVLKTLVINPQDKILNGQITEDDEDDGDGGDREEDEDDVEEGDNLDEEDQREIQEQFRREGNYLKYQLPNKDSKSLRRDLTVSLNGLHIRDILLHPQSVASRFPCYKRLTGMMFIYQNRALWMENDNLRILPISEDAFAEALQKYTGRNWEQVQARVFQYHSWDGHRKLSQEQEEEFIKGHQFLIISKKFILEVSKGTDCRALFDSSIAMQRLTNRREERNIRDFQIDTDNQNDTRIATWNSFLSERLEQGVTWVSYENLVKDSEKDKEAQKSAGKQKSNHKKKDENRNLSGYRALGLTATSKKSQWDNDLSSYLKIDLRNPKNEITDWSKGIRFDETHQQYMVGQKNAFNNKQTRSNLVRGIMMIEGEFDKDKFFPLLNVTFVRYKGYSVRPFPFWLIEKWIDLQKDTGCEVSKEGG